MDFGHHRMMKVALLSLWAAYCLANVSNAIGDEPSDAELVKKLSPIWDHQRTGIKSAVIDFRRVSRGAQPARQHADIAALVCNTGWVTNEAALRILIPKLDASLQGAQELWCPRKFTTDGIDARDDTTSQTMRTSLVHSGEFAIESSDSAPRGGTQIDIESRSKTHRGMSALRDFNRIPSRRFSENGLIDRSGELAAGRVLIKADSEEVVADERTGFVYEYRQHDRAGDDEVFQFTPVKYDDDAVLPTAIFSGRYVGGTLYKFTIILIDSATINQPIAPDAFKVGGKKGDVVVDRSDGRKTISELGHQVLDVLNP